WTEIPMFRRARQKHGNGSRKHVNPAGRGTRQLRVSVDGDRNVGAHSYGPRLAETGGAVPSPPAGVGGGHRSVATQAAAVPTQHQVEQPVVELGRGSDVEYPRIAVYIRGHESEQRQAQLAPVDVYAGLHRGPGPSDAQRLRYVRQLAPAPFGSRPHVA